MSNEVKLTLAGDAAPLKKATEEATGATDKMEKGFGKSVAGAVAFTQGLAGLGDAVTGVTDLMQEQAGKADRLARQQNDVAQAAVDVEQAMHDSAQATLDFTQAQKDATQAGLDIEQALLDQEQAQKDYNDAVKEHGKKSIEARQAALDLKQATADAAQASQDQKQAQSDAAQALIDTKNAAVGVTSAQLDMSEAQREANKSGFAKGVEEVGKYLNVLMPVIMLVTGAQWLFNASLLASPITWIVLGIAAIIAIIVLLIVYWDDVKKYAEIAWNWIWAKLKAFGEWLWDTFWTNGIKKVVDLIIFAFNKYRDIATTVFQWVIDKGKSFLSFIVGIPEKIGNIFSKIADFIKAPFRAAFNFIADAWNNTIGALHWTIPNWVPGIGGNTISAPNLPHFHDGGVVGGGAEGAEVMAVLRVGERVQTREMQAREGMGGVIINTLNVNGNKFRDGTDFEDWLDNLRNNTRSGEEVYA